MHRARCTHSQLPRRLIQDRPPNPCSQAGYARITTGISVFVLALLILKSIHEGPAKVPPPPAGGLPHTCFSAC